MNYLIRNILFIFKMKLSRKLILSVCFSLPLLANSAENIINKSSGFVAEDTSSSFLHRKSEPCVYKIKKGETVLKFLSTHHYDIDAVWAINSFGWANKTVFLKAEGGTIIYMPEYSKDLNCGKESETQREKFLAKQFYGLGQSLGGRHVNNRQDAFNNYALGLAGNIISQQAESWLGKDGSARVTLGFNSHKGFSGGSADMLLPLYDDKARHLFFTQIGARRKESVNTVNVGLGTRYFIHNWMYGANIFYDDDVTGHNRRWGMGGELWTDNLKLSANGYFRLTDWHSSSQIQDYDERPANGYDLRAEAFLPSLPQLGTQIKYERYLGKEVALSSVNERQENPQAVTVGIKYTPVPLVTLGAGYRIEERGKRDRLMSLQLRYVFDQNILTQLDPGEVANMRLLSSNRSALVERNNNIVLDYRKQVLVRLSLPSFLEGESEKIINLSVNVIARHGPPVLRWSADALMAAGGKLDGDGKTWQVTLPAWRAEGNNEYVITGVAIDSLGNESAAATTIIRVKDQSVSLLNSNVSVNHDKLPADGRSASVLTVILRNDDGKPVTKREKALTTTLESGSSGVSMNAGAFIEASPGVYHSLLIAGTHAGLVHVTTFMGKMKLPSVDISLLTNMPLELKNPGTLSVPFVPGGSVPVKIEGGNGGPMAFDVVEGDSVAVASKTGANNVMIIKLQKPGHTKIIVHQRATNGFAAPADIFVDVIVTPNSLPALSDVILTIGATYDAADHKLKSSNGGTISYSSENSRIVEVSENGTLHAVGLSSEGVIITVTERRAGSDEIQTRYRVIVVKKTPPPLKVNTDIDLIYDVDPNKTAKISQIISGGNGGAMHVWTEDDAVLAELTDDHRLRVIAKGIPSKPVNVHIEQESTAESVSPNEVIIRVYVMKGELPSLHLKDVERIITKDTDETNSLKNLKRTLSIIPGTRIKYASRSPEIAIVDPNTGKVTGLKDGKALITVTKTREGYKVSQEYFFVTVINRYGALVQRVVWKRDYSIHLLLTLTKTDVGYLETKLAAPLKPKLVMTGTGEILSDFSIENDIITYTYPGCTGLGHGSEFFECVNRVDVRAFIIDGEEYEIYEGGGH